MTDDLYKHLTKQQLTHIWAEFSMFPMQNNELKLLTQSRALVINMVCGLFMLLSSFVQANSNALQFYSETSLTMLQAGLGACIAAIGLTRTTAKTQVIYLLASSTILALLFFPVAYALSKWPGGDDGGGFGWMLCMGGGSILSLIVGCLTAGSAFLWSETKDNTQNLESIDNTLVQSQADQSPKPCQGCGELLEPQFDSCWKCGKHRQDRVSL